MNPSRRELEARLEKLTRDLELCTNRLNTEIAERKHSERQLKESNERLESILFALPSGILLIDTQTYHIVIANPQTMISTCTPIEQIVGQCWTRFILNANGDPCIPDTIGNISRRNEYLLMTSDDEKIPVHISVVPVALDGRQCILLSLMDISEEKRSELERIQKEKLQGVIEMAGAVCHELNQPIQAVSGYSEMAMMHLDEAGPAFDKILKITECVDRMAAITRKLMGITRYETRDYLERRIIDINKATN